MDEVGWPAKFAGETRANGGITMLPKSIGRGLLAGLFTVAAAAGASAAGPSGDLGSASPAKVSVSPFYDFSALPALEEAAPKSKSTLIRTNEGVRLSVNTADLEPNSVYTFWWVIFNKPEKCMEPYDCSFGDIGVEGSAAFYANGRVTDAYGQASFTSSLAYGEGSAGLGPDQVVKPGALESPRAQINLVVRTHQDVADLKEEGQLEAAVSNLIGGCSDDPRTAEPNDGPGSATCSDPYMIVHKR